jgi:xanthine dehydrogenase small subunit
MSRSYAPRSRYRVRRAAKDPLVFERKIIAARLAALRDGSRVEIGAWRPDWCPGRTSTILPRARCQSPKATVVAGATDVGLWVTKFMRDFARWSSSAGWTGCSLSTS